MSQNNKRFSKECYRSGRRVRFDNDCQERAMRPDKIFISRELDMVVWAFIRMQDSPNDCPKLRKSGSPIFNGRETFNERSKIEEIRTFDQEARLCPSDRLYIEYIDIDIRRLRRYHVSLASRRDASIWVFYISKTTEPIKL